MKKHTMFQPFSLFLILALFSTLLVGCSGNSEQLSPTTKSSLLLNTVVTISLYDSTDESIIDEAFSLCEEYEFIFSRTSADSELYRLNNRLLNEDSNTFMVSSDLSSLIQQGLYYSELSNGTFDITIEPISSLWDFQAEIPTIPDSSFIEEQLANVDYRNVTVSNTGVSFLSDETSLDLGAIAKGYIADRVKEFLIGKGITSAMINLGGNILCIGDKPDGTPFQIGIQMPFADRNKTIAVMEIIDSSVVSSGIYERFFEDDDTIYHHILNPMTGYPYDNDLISVTIISKESVDGDGLSTAAFALGLDEGLALIDSLEDVHAVFITSDYELHYSKGFSDAISIQTN